MLFSSLVFLICFLPIVLFIYYVLLRKNKTMQNSFLLLSSLIFYAWGEPKFVLILIISVVVNWFIAYQIDEKRTNTRLVKTLIVADIIFNLILISI